MDKQQQQVREFMLAMEQPTPDKPTMLDRRDGRLQMRVGLIQDELKLAAGWKELQPKDLVPGEPRHLDMIDALVDILYVTNGMAIEMGVDLEPFWDEVHAANMRKVGGPIREDGKRLKPPGWRAPDIAAVFARHYGPQR